MPGELVSGFIITPLRKIVQGLQEDFSDFASRLLEATEQTMGHEDTDNKPMKQMEYEKANVACGSTLWGQYLDKDLNEMIGLCQELDPFSHKMSQAVNLAVGKALQPMLAVEGAFQQTTPQKKMFQMWPIWTLCPAVSHYIFS